MMKKLIKSTKGITLIALAITIAVIMIVTSITLANLKGNLRIKGLQKLQADIDNLRDAISAYYMQYGKIPAKCKYNTDASKIDSISKAVDTAGKFFVIDLSAIDNLTLNYGRDYENVKKLDEFKNSSELTESEMEQYTDLYIINEDSHNIFYVQGIELNGDVYYTDYTSEEKDTQEIEIIDAPETVADSKIRDYNFWTTTELTDDSNKKVIIPAGFKIAEDSSTYVSEGIVIEDVSSHSTLGSQFVWIPCTVEQYQNAKNAVMTQTWKSNDEYKDNASTSENNTGGQGDGLGWSDEYLDSDIENVEGEYNKNEEDGESASGTTNEIISKWKNSQTKIAEVSINQYGGFYIARYEAGIPNDSVGSESNKVETNKIGLDKIINLVPVSKKNAQVWNYITQPNAKIVSENMYKTSSSVESYLVDSQAWNHICTNIFFNSSSDSSSWGNYSGNQIQTGSNGNFKKYNIYDMAGNMWEWTTGHHIKSGTSTMYVVSRGRFF